MTTMSCPASSSSCAPDLRTLRPITSTGMRHRGKTVNASMVKRASVLNSTDERGDDGDGLLDDVPRDLRQRLLRDPRLIEDRLHEFARFRAIEKLERLPEQMPEELLSDVVQHPLADPEQAVGIQIGEKTRAPPSAAGCSRK